MGIGGVPDTQLKVQIHEGGYQEVSAGAVLVSFIDGNRKALLIRISLKNIFEIPKGHVELYESDAEAAVRELREETGIQNDIVVVDEIEELRYSFKRKGSTVTERVKHFLVTPGDGQEIRFGPKPEQTLEIRWVTKEEVATIPLVAENLRPALRLAFEKVEEMSKVKKEDCI